MKILRIIISLLVVVTAGLYYEYGDQILNQNGGTPSAQSASAGDPEDCVLTNKVEEINLDPNSYPETVDHAQDAISTGQPKVLHLDRAGADANRATSLEGIDTQEGYDRDEYPPAVSREGGEGASVRLVPLSDNRGAGSSMGAQLREFCSGQAFRLVFN